MDWLLIIDEGLQTKQQSIQFSELFNPPAWWRWFLVNKWQRDAEFDFILALIIRIDSSPIPSPLLPLPPSPLAYSPFYLRLFIIIFRFVSVIFDFSLIFKLFRWFPALHPLPLPPLLPVGPASHFLEKKRTQTNSMKSSTLFSPFLLFLHSINTQKNYNIINSSIIITTTKKKK